MAKRSPKKDFDREQMYQKIMPSLQPAQSAERAETAEPPPPPPVREETEKAPAAVNLMALVLEEMLEQPLSILRCCGCPRCREDVTALALNQLPPRYVLAEAEELPPKIAALRAQFEVKAKAALIRAIQQVKANPRHSL